MYKSKKTGIIGIILTIIVLILLVLLSNVEMKNLSIVETSVSKLVMPIQNGLTYLKNKIQGNSSFFADINNLQQENEQLKQRNSELEQELRELEIIKAENAILKEYEGLREKYSEYKTVPAYIINKDISNYSSTLIINVGTNDGIKEKMTVIADKGLVGHIISVTDTTAKVQVIIDPASTVSATLESSRDLIITRGILGQKNTLRAAFIQTETVLVKDEGLETSGLGGIYPKGIQIGTIKEIVETKNITDRYAIIETAVDFGKIETVLVII